MKNVLINISGYFHPVPLFLHPGTYLFELYGASGGGSQPGKGGFATGVLSLKQSLQVYLYTGGEGSYQDGGGCVEGGWNGGGRSCSTKFPSSGGGSSDVRLIKDDDSSRIIVAGAGGGSGEGRQTPYYGSHPGGDGGGYEGGSVKGYSSRTNENIYANGGTQSGPGTSFIMKFGNYINSNGKGSKGGDGAGGGYYGGGGGFDVTGGGGGSSYISPIFQSRNTISGSQTQYKGNGIITIYILKSSTCKYLETRSKFFSLTLIVIFYKNL